jgi:predicted RNA-binding Zn ribbon-like protein
MDSLTTDDGGRELAPGKLLFVQELLNTLDVELGVDELPDIDALAGWLRARELLGPADALAPADLERAHAFREGLRALIDERSHGAIRDETLSVLNELPAGALLRTRFDAGGAPQLVPVADGLDHALAEFCAIIDRAALEGTWARLKVCAESTCMYAYYDRSKNRSGSWCSMAVCGNRSKARSYRERQRTAREE